jgi:hypothetical protein
VVIKAWHLLAVAALALLALGALGALLLSGGGTKTVVVNPFLPTHTVPARPQARAAARALANAEADLRRMFPDIAQWNVDHHGYAGMTAQTLSHAYDPAFPSSITVVAADPTTYCVEADIDGQAANQAGPNASIVPGPCIPNAP